MIQSVNINVSYTTLKENPPYYFLLCKDFQFFGNYHGKFKKYRFMKVVVNNRIVAKLLLYINDVMSKLMNFYSHFRCKTKLYSYFRCENE